MDASGVGGPRLPSVSVVIPVLNEERRLPRVLGSIAAQDYPASLIEILVADGGSRDRSVEIAESYSDRLQVKVLDNSIGREAEAGKTLAIQHAGGELIQFLDADMWLTRPTTLRRLVEPLAMDDALAGSVAAYAFLRELPLWSRFLSLDELQRDPLLQALTPDMDGFVVERGPHFDVCEFRTHRIPPIGGTTVFRRRSIDPTRWGGVWREVDHPVYLIKRGENRFAYVRDAGVAHEHCTGLRDLVRKRLRNPLLLSTGYLRLESPPDYVWLDPSDRREVLRLVRWIVGTNLLVPRVVEAIQEAIAKRRIEALLRPIAAIAVTDALLWGFVRSHRGRRLMGEALQRLGRR